MACILECRQTGPLSPPSLGSQPGRLRLNPLNPLTPLGAAAPEAPAPAPPPTACLACWITFGGSLGPGKGPIRLGLAGCAPPAQAASPPSPKRPAGPRAPPI